MTFFFRLTVLPLLFLWAFFPSLVSAQAAAPAPGATSPPASSARVVQSPSFQQILDEGLLRANVDPDCQSMGNCSIYDIIQLFLNVITLLIGISGSVFLLMFIWGGFTWLLSGGSPTRFQAGLDTIRDAVIGLAILLGAYLIVNTFLSLVRTGNLPTEDLGTTIDEFTEIDAIDLQSTPPN